MNSNFGIIVVDDDLLVMEVIRRFVQKLGMWCFPTTSGISAIEFYLKNEQSIKMVILDLIIFPIDGRKTYKELRHISPHLGILFSSGNDKDTIDDLLKADQKCAFLQKPFTFSAFENTLLNLMKKADIKNEIPSPIDMPSSCRKTGDLIETALF